MDNTTINATNKGTTPAASVFTSAETSQIERETPSDLPPAQQVHSASKADRVEISDVSRALAKLSDQSSDKPELQLSPDKLQEMANQ